MQHLELKQTTINQAVVILTEDVGREGCGRGACVALPSGAFSLWGTEDPDPGCHETNVGRDTLSVSG